MGDQEMGVLLPAENRESVLTVSRSHPSFCPTIIVDAFFGGKATRL
jgi:hypothetical protein